MPRIEAIDVSKSFGGVHALQGASFEADGGEVHALVGENGAGKSTLIKILSGLLRPDGGQLRVDGQEVRIDRPAAAQRLGIGTVFQELTLLPHMTVAENLLLRREPRDRFGLIRPRELSRQAAELLSGLGLREFDVDSVMSGLPLAQRQLLEIAKVVSRAPRILLFDEPTSALAEREVTWLMDVIRRLRDGGRTIVFTSHRWNEVHDISDRITIFRNGQRVGTFAAADIDENRAVELMTGRHMSAVFPPLPPLGAPEAILEVRGLAAGRVQGVDLTLHRGEILGIGGLQGQGQRDLFLSLFGAQRLRAGTIAIQGRRVAIRHPREAISAGIGIALVPEDRKVEGLFLPMSVRQNMTLPVLGALSRLGYVDLRRETDTVGRMIDQLAIRTTGPDQIVGALSGGNQQKVLIGRWLVTNARILLLYDVTRGVDVATKHDIYDLVTALSAEGRAILYYSSDTAEMAHLCHRVLVMREGRVATELRGREITADALVRASLRVGGEVPA
ncbi:MAG TPA: sugar ABC transporter ATP-binding protein [bacterium]|nr:sugar ABC transporter ATP-binding protein [bacterium]